MAKRSRDWNEGLSKDLRSNDFAREFLMAVLEEGVSLQVALGKIVRAYGVKKFGARIKIASPNVPRAINPKYNPTQEMSYGTV